MEGRNRGVSIMPPAQGSSPTNANSLVNEDVSAVEVAVDNNDEDEDILDSNGDGDAIDKEAEINFHDDGEDKPREDRGEFANRVRTLEEKRELLTRCTVKVRESSYWETLEATYVDSVIRPDPGVKRRWRKPGEHSKEREHESIDPMRPHSIAYRKHLAGNKPNSQWNKYLEYMLIGIITGLVGFLLFEIIEVIIEKRKELLVYSFRRGREHSSIGEYMGAYCSWVGTGVFLATAGMLIVVWQPAASGSGVTEVMSCLNGVVSKKVFQLRTLVAKVVSAICAVSSGLPVGPEGPIILMGSIIGGCVNNARVKLFDKVPSPQDHRDTITAGAAAGVAVAFGAPVGGLLFVFEEIATHWHHSLTPLIFCCSLLASYIYGLFASQLDGHGLRHETSFGGLIDDATIFFNSYTDRHMASRDLPMAFVIGVACGVMAALFTLLNLGLTKIRTAADDPERKSKKKLFNVLRGVEPAIVAVLFLTLSFVAPMILECKEFPVDGSGDGSFNEIGGVNLSVTAPCSKDNYYSPSATLFWNSGISIIKLLFRKSTEFDTLSLIFFGVAYFLFSCYSCGLKLASGIVIPMLVSGGVMGRLIGKFIYHHIDSSQHEGVYAVLGAAGYFAGVSRLSVSLAVIMIELTNEKRVLFPIMVSIITARAVASLLSPSLYHTQLSIKSVPFLNLADGETLDNKHFACFRASEICKPAVVCLREFETVESIIATLAVCKHNGFPVVDRDYHFLGMITRGQINALLTAFMDGIDKHLDDISNEYLVDLPWEKLAILQEQLKDSPTPEIPERFLHKKVNLIHHADSSALTVNSGASVSTVFHLFVSLGLRHLVVVTEKGQVNGLLTRHDLMPHRLEERMKKSLRNAYTTRADALMDSDEDAPLLG
eukprot:TRINITY_DN2747_c0_g1_i1.p1 TRINITY_DN2747_c0_g1~~TRINITY_DN2747_c0_g1_i1.p1  ORF type:complete len:898 (+),score=144.63 TRINITY_DN2747_c0_g1_i1:45-2696(+)